MKSAKQTVTIQNFRQMVEKNGEKDLSELLNKIATGAKPGDIRSMGENVVLDDLLWGWRA